MLLLLLAALGIASARAAGAAGASEAPRGHGPAVERVDAKPITVTNAARVSGELSDEVWRDAAPVDAFLQREPEEGGEPTERTEFRVAYDSQILYVKVRAFDREPDKIITYLTRRDQDSA